MAEEKNDVDFIAEDKLIKETVLHLVREHKNHCKGDCGISIYLMLVLLKKAGIEVPKEEVREFLWKAIL